MYNPQASFRNILSPVKAEDFFETDYGCTVRYIPGPDDKFSGLYSWDDLNRCMNFDKVWDSFNVKMVMDSEPVPPVNYCPEGNLDRAILAKYLDQGATLVLSGFETLCDGAGALFKSIQTATKSPCGGVLYYSKKEHAGFRPHFDIMDVFVIQIAGEKLWTIYESQFENPILKPGYHSMSFSHDHHRKNKGAIEAEITMTPGDVLYIPRGKYHSALAKSDSCLHLSFGIEPARGIDYLQSLIDTMHDDPLFREEIPSFDHFDAQEAYIGKLADRIREKMVNPEFIAQMGGEQRRRVYENLPIFSMPNSSRIPGFRVRVTGSKLLRRGKNWLLITPRGQSEISAEISSIAKWMLLSDLFTFENLKDAFADSNDDQLGKAILSLTDAGLIEGF